MAAVLTVVSQMQPHLDTGHGGAGFLWWLAWNFLVYNSPAEHPRITAAERDYIIRITDKATYDKKDHNVPWRSIVTSPAVWAIVAGHASYTWGLYTVLTTIPMYMKEVLKFDIKQNGALSALPFAAMYVVQIGAGVLADFLLERHILSTITARKTWTVIACLLPAVCMLGIAFVTCQHRYVAVGLLVVAVGFASFGRTGWGVNHIDIAPQYAGIVYGMSNTVATVSGMVSPPLVGLLTPNGTQAEWQRVFFICAAVYTSCAIIFVIFAKGTQQKWAKGHKGDTVTPLEQGECHSHTEPQLSDVKIPLKA